MKSEGVGILAFGGYVPRLRLQHSAVVAANGWFNSGLKALAKGERAMANWDEDIVTMAVEAARDCLTGENREHVKRIILGSTSFPFLDRQNATIVKEALNLADDVGSADMGSSQRAGTSALIMACQATAGGGGPVLCIASDKRRAKPGSERELTNGDGAAALLIGTGNPVARFIGCHSLSVDFVDHYRGAGEKFDYDWENRWVRDEGYNKIVPAAIAEALLRFGLDATEIDHFILPCTMKNVAEKIARDAGFRAGVLADALATSMGEAGTAHALVMLVHCLQRANPGEKILLTGFGQGCDILVFEATEALLGLALRAGIEGWLRRRRQETNYIKFLFFNGLLDLEQGIRAEADKQTALTNLYRNRKTILGLVGGRCRKTGLIQFPQTAIAFNAANAEISAFDDYPLADKPAIIMSYTADNLTYTPDPPHYYGMVLFEGGGRMMADFTDVDAEDISVGRAMRMVFRIKAVDGARGFTKYFWKAAPAVDIKFIRER